MPNEQKRTLTIIVNGLPFEVQANDNAPLRTVIPLALHTSGNSGQPPEQWELRDAQGNLLDLDRKIETYGFNTHTPLFLNLQSGVGG